MSASYNTLIGYQAQLPVAEGQHQIVIGSAAATTYLGGTAVVCNSGSLRVNASGYFSNGITVTGPIVALSGIVTDSGLTTSGLLYSGGAATLVGPVSACGALTVAGASTLIGAVTMCGGLTVASTQNVTVNNQTIALPLSLATLGNTVLGTSGLSSLTTGNQNTAQGASALAALTTGSGNVAIGFQSASGLTTGTKNVLIGTGAAASAVGVNNEIVVGAGATGLGTNTATFGGSTSTNYVALALAGQQLSNPLYQIGGLSSWTTQPTPSGTITQNSPIAITSQSLVAGSYLIFTPIPFYGAGTSIDAALTTSADVVIANTTAIRGVVGTTDGIVPILTSPLIVTAAAAPLQVYLSIVAKSGTPSWIANSNFWVTYVMRIG